MDEKKLNKVRSVNISTTEVTDRNEQTANTKDTTLRAELTVLRKKMFLAVIGSLLLSTVISVIAGINVYRVTIAKMADKMADSGKQDQDIASTTFSQYQADALTLTVKELRKNVTAFSDVWNEEMASLKTNVSEIDSNLNTASDERITLSSRLTTASDIWNEEMKSLKTNVSEIESNLTVASVGWYEEMRSLNAIVSEMERNLSAASDALNESIARSYSKDCSELYAAGTVMDGVYTISPDGRCPFQVYCDMKGGGWTLIQKRLDGLVTFYRTWKEYVDGFGNIDGDHWLGLDNIHRLTAGGSEIYFHFEHYDGNIGFAHYQAFSVHDASTAYRMNVDAFGYNGTIKDKSSNTHNNMMFSTWDRDNDGSSMGNCAMKYEGAWWYMNKYYDCYRFGNLNGVFGKQQDGGIAYSTGNGNTYVKYVNIKVKPSPGYC